MPRVVLGNHNVPRNQPGFNAQFIQSVTSPPPPFVNNGGHRMIGVQPHHNGGQGILNGRLCRIVFVIS